MKTIKTIVKIIVAAMVGLMLAAWADEHHVGYRYAFVSVYLFGSVVVYYAIEGIITVLTKRGRNSRYESIRHQRRDYGQAAVFVGTACLFIGTQTECDDRADDLWHYGVQARVEQLTGEETSFNII